jgi:poly(3-hydroxybutyrate) depolymerase
MPLTVFDIKGVPGTRRERIEAAVVAGGSYSNAIALTAPVVFASTALVASLRPQKKE